MDDKTSSKPVCPLSRNDFFNDRTGLRRSAFPIKLAGIKMGSQENLNADNDNDNDNAGEDENVNAEISGNGSSELQQLWRRRSSRHNSVSSNDSRRNSFSAGNGTTRDQCYKTFLFGHNVFHLKLQHVFGVA